MENIKNITNEMILSDLSQGLTRYRKDDKGYGSIEEKYALSVREIFRLFQDPKIKGKRTRIPSVFPTKGLSIKNVVDNAFKYFSLNGTSKHAFR